MPTNFPGSLDTLGAGGTLGGPFIDAAAPVDLFEDIAADFRSNTNDALLAVQARVGLTDDTNPGSLSWATISVGGVNNLGLRFAQEESEWPGEVAESGIFLKDGTFEPMFHRAGETKATFYSMLGGGGGGGTLQDAYDASATPAIVTLASGKPTIFLTDATGGFIVAESTSTYGFLSADETTAELVVGDNTGITVNIAGKLSADLGFDGSAHSIENSANLFVRTTGASDLSLISGNDAFVNTVGVFNVTAGTNSLYSGGNLSFLGTGKVTVGSSAGGVDLDTTTGSDISLLSGDKIIIRSGGAGSEEMSLLTGSDDPSSVAKWAQRGSLYLRDDGAAGELYIKQDNASSTNWNQLGAGGGGGTLQDAYDASGVPAVIAMTGATKHVNFRTHSTGASFIVSDQADANTFISADESAGSMTLGSTTVYTLDLDGHVASNIQFTGGARSILNTSPLTIETAGVGPMAISVLASGVLTLRGLAVDLQSGGGGGEIMNLVTGTTDPSSVAATGTRGSLFLRDTGAAGELYVKQDDGSSTNWTQLGVGGGGTLQDAYDAGNAIVTAGGLPLAISGPEDFLWQSDASNFFFLGSASIESTVTAGLLGLVNLVGVDEFKGIKVLVGNNPGNNGWEFGAFHADVTNASDMLDTEVIYGHSAKMTMLGDGPGAGFSVSAAFYAESASFGGSNLHISTGMYVDASYDFSIVSFTGAANFEWGASTEYFTFDAGKITGGNTDTDGLLRVIGKSGLQASVLQGTALSIESVGGGGDQLGGIAHQYKTTSTGGSSNPLLAGGGLTSINFEHSMDATDAPTSLHEALHIGYLIPDSGGGLHNVGASAFGVYVDIPESKTIGGLYSNNDGTFAFYRWAFWVEAGESHLRRTEFEGPGDLDKALVRFNQVDNNAPFHELQGRWDVTPATPDCNLADNDTGGVVVGPKANDWTWLGMYQVYVIDVAGHIGSGHYWVPLYEAI